MTEWLNKILFFQNMYIKYTLNRIAAFKQKSLTRLFKDAFSK